MGDNAVVLKLLGPLLGEATLEDIQYHLYALQKIMAGSRGR
ncbi:MAG: hypothetical protein Q8N04_00040 [Nitrospira sp.]|nr:hypothetical protein [Nitrospira sp.]